jgi:uncharacterized RDD family membrane protein YckC
MDGNRGQQEESMNERIGFWTRLGAYCIDIVVIMVTGIILGIFVGDHLAPILFGEQMAQFDSLYGNLGTKFADILTRTMEITSGISITGLSLFILEGALGQSYGKMILKIKNTNVDGSPASAQTLWLRSFLKYAASIVSLIASVLGLLFLTTIASLWSFVIFVGFFLVFMDNRQTIHDMIAKTVVSKV